MSFPFDTTKLFIINDLIVQLHNEDIPLQTRLLNFLNRLTSVIYYDRATLLFFYKNNQGDYCKHSSVSVNWDKDADTVKTYDDYYCREDDTLPVFDQPTPIVFRSTEFFDTEERKNNKYYSEYLLPNNCPYSLEGNLQLKNNHDLRGGFNLYRGKNRHDFTEEEAVIMQLFQPHLSSILRNYGEKNDSARMTFTLENNNCVGVAILDDNCQVIQSNSTFKDIIDQSEIGRMISAKMVTLCLSLTKKNNIENKVCVEHKFSDAPVYMEVAIASDSFEQDHRSYICMIYDLSRFVAKTLDQAKNQFSLSTREFEVLQEVLRGKSNAEIASQLYLSLPTVKRYLASIYSKMEIKNQKQIFDKLNLQ